MPSISSPAMGRPLSLSTIVPSIGREGTAEYSKPAGIVDRPRPCGGESLGVGGADRRAVAVGDEKLGGGDRRRRDDQRGQAVGAEAGQAESAIVAGGRVALGRQRPEAVPGPADALLRGAVEPVRQAALEGEPEELDLDPGAGDRPALEVDDPALDRRAGLHQPEDGFLGRRRARGWPRSSPVRSPVPGPRRPQRGASCPAA